MLHINFTAVCVALSHSCAEPQQAFRQPPLHKTLCGDWKNGRLKKQCNNGLVDFFRNLIIKNHFSSTLYISNYLLFPAVTSSSIFVVWFSLISFALTCVHMVLTSSFTESGWICYNKCNRCNSPNKRWHETFGFKRISGIFPIFCFSFLIQRLERATRIKGTALGWFQSYLSKRF